MGIKFTNNASTTLAANVGTTDTLITVVDSSKFSVPTGGDYQVVTLQNADKTISEIIYVKGNSVGTNTLTVVRGKEGTNALSWTLGDSVFAGVTAGVLNSVGVQVLTNENYFTNDDYKYLSIGNGSGTDGADFFDIYAFVDFINSVSVRSYNAIFGYFKNPGVVTLTKDIHITNSQTFGNVFIQGAGVDGTVENGPWSDPTSGTITNVNINPNASNSLVVTVSSVAGLYVGGLMAIYPDTSGNLAYPKQFIGAWPIGAIDVGAKTVTLYALDLCSGMQTPANIATGTKTNLSMPFICNRTTITGGKTIYVEGTLGNSDMDGGFYNISFHNSRLNLPSKQSFVLLYNNVHFHDGNIVVNYGNIHTWGDVFLMGVYFSVFCGSYFAQSDTYFALSIVNGLNRGNISGNGADILFNRLITSSNVLLDFKLGTRILLGSPSIADLTSYSPTAKAGSSIIVAASEDI